MKFKALDGFRVKGLPAWGRDSRCDVGASVCAPLRKLPTLERPAASRPHLRRALVTMVYRPPQWQRPSSVLGKGKKKRETHTTSDPHRSQATLGCPHRISWVRSCASCGFIRASTLASRLYFGGGARALRVLEPLIGPPPSDSPAYHRC